ncbi:Protein kinase-like domain protein [Metarhizium rileyi]|uniref:Protein kinase-like domain protein n=1 Tax=Metarhizium rileyi (strain RCEF 4871) TaxID=1649241 RepID=A0A166RV90_METRR|nr:Protein kinase-like domain protein [Metarhizium rileyi RCEF 4871]
MALRITEWEDLAFFDEEVDDETGQFRHTSFAAFDADDNAYFGKLNETKSNISFLQLSFALAPISDNALFPEWALYNVELTKAPDTLPPNTYVKHPNLAFYEIFKEHNVLNLISKVRRGRITGLVLDRHSNTLNDYLKNKVGSVDKEPFMQALTSAIYHLHSLDWAHNDLNPRNILVDNEGTSPNRLRVRPRGTKGWIDGEMKDYHTSDKRHDLFAMEKIRVWLDALIFDD